MLLRSITKHVKEQNWFAVGLDFVVVVVGILIALQISNWNEAKQERQAEKALVRSLEGDFETLKNTLGQRFARSERLIADTSELIDLIRRTNEPTDISSTKQMLLSASLFSAPVVRPTSFVDGLQSGRISSLQNADLRRALNDYAISTDWWATVKGAPEPQTNPNSQLNSALVWEAEGELESALKRNVLKYEWDRVVKAERELVIIHRRQTLQAEAYRLELVAVDRVLAALRVETHQ